MSPRRPPSGPLLREWSLLLIVLSGMLVPSCLHGSPARRDYDGYLAFYNGQSGSSVYHISSATSADGVHWTRNPRIPVLAPTAGWESRQTVAPCAVAQGDLIYLYYSGYNGRKYQIGLAVSRDRGRTFVRHPANPVVRVGERGAVDELGAGYCTVIYDPSDPDPAKRWKMWYRAQDWTKRSTIAYCYSPDGVIWHKFGRVLDLGAPGAWDDNALETGAAPVKIDDTWHMFYSGNHTYAGRTRWGGGLVTFTSPEGEYTRHGQVVFPLDTHATRLTADMVRGSRLVVVADTSIFQVNEGVFLTDNVTPPKQNRIVRIVSATQLELRDEAGADFFTRYSAALRSVYSWSVGPRSVFWDHDRWVMPVTSFQQNNDIRKSYLTELSTWAYNQNPALTGKWTFDMDRGVAVDLGKSGDEAVSADNWSVIRLPAMALP